MNNRNCRLKTGVGVVLLSVMMTACQAIPDVPPNYQGSDPSTRNHNKDEVAKIRTSLAAQYIRENKLDAAKKQLEMALKANNRYAPAYDMMGVLLQTEGSPANLARADEYFRRAIALDKDFIQAHNNYGVYLSIMGKYNEAVREFSLAGSTLGYEGRAGALENLGMTHKKLGNIKLAKEALIKAIEANNNIGKARVELIDILLDENNPMLAKRLFDELVAIAGNRTLPPYVLLQGIKIALLQDNVAQWQLLSQTLFSDYPLSDEAKRLKAWLVNPNKPLQ